MLAGPDTACKVIDMTTTAITFRADPADPAATEVYEGRWLVGVFLSSWDGTYSIQRANGANTVEHGYATTDAAIDALLGR